MAAHMNRQTWSLSRQTVQGMLELKSLLRSRGITVALGAPDAFELLIQAAAAVDDDAITDLRLRLIEAGDPRVSSGEHRPLGEDEPIPNRDDTALEGHSDTSSPSERLPSKRVEVRPLDQSSIPPRTDTAKPIAKKIHLYTPLEGLLTCEQCQRILVVRFDHPQQTQPVHVQCPCGRPYQIEMEPRKYSRKSTQLAGVYRDHKDATKTGDIIVENISFGGVQFRTTSPHCLARDDRLHVQFTLDDEHQTCIQEQIRVCNVQGHTIGTEFLNTDAFNVDLAAYIIR